MSSLRQKLLLLLLTSASVVLFIHLNTVGTKPVHAANSITIVASDGTQLTGLFVGLRPNPLFSLKDILSVQREHDQCLEKRNKQLSLLDRLMGVTPVFAQCSVGSCTGKYWAKVEYPCSYWSCSGAANDTDYDPDLAGPCDGDQQFHCDFNCIYCPYSQCNSCG